jgi:hypothetical protein
MRRFQRRYPCRNRRGVRSYGARRSSDEKTVSLLASSVSHLEKYWKLQLELPLGLEDEKRRPGTKRGMARWTADRAIDMIRERFGWDAVGYGSVVLGLPNDLVALCERCHAGLHHKTPANDNQLTMFPLLAKDKN